MSIFRINYIMYILLIINILLYYYFKANLIKLIKTKYSFKIFMDDINTISTYNICEDSLLAVLIMIDMVVLGELFTRMSIDDNKFWPILSYLSFFFKAPTTNHPEYVINSFSRQRETIVNLIETIFSTY